MLKVAKAQMLAKMVKQFLDIIMVEYVILAFSDQ